MKNFILTLVLITLTGCSYNDENTCLINIKQHISELAPGEQLSFEKELDCFDWDKMLFLPRDFDVDDLNEKLGLDLNGYKLMGFKYYFKSDFYTYVLFLNDNNDILNSFEVKKPLLIDEFVESNLSGDLFFIQKAEANFMIYDSNETFTNDNTPILLLKYKEKR